jgi:outer membrane lipoprotein-sorting protein
LNPCRERARSARASGRTVLLAAALLLLQSGCAAVSPLPTAPAVPAKRWEAAQIIDAINQRQVQFRTLRALARVDYSGPDGKQGFQEAVHVQRPDRLRLETLSMLGAILIVTVNDKEIVGYHPREGLFLRGERTKQNLFRYTQIPLELDEITMLLVGLPPVDAESAWREEGGGLVFSANGRKRDLVVFDTEQAVPTRWERFDDYGAVALSARFSDYKNTLQGLFPTRIFIEAPPEGKKLDIRFEEPELNAALSADLFFQQKPLHAQELPIEALGG